MIFITIIILVQNKDTATKEKNICSSTHEDIEKYNEMFSEEELKWIDENKNKTLTVGIAKDYIPIEYMDEEGNPKGIGVEILRKVSGITGLKFKLYDNIENETWSELLESFKSKKIDLLSAVSGTEARSTYMQFSTPFIETTLVVLGHRSNFEVLTGIQAIDNGTVAIPKGYWIVETIKKQNPNIDIILVDNMQQAMKYVNNKKADYAVCEIPIFTYYKEQGLYSNLKIVGELEDKNKIRIGVQKDSQYLLSIIDKIIMNIERDQIYEKALIMPKTNKKKKD